MNSDQIRYILNKHNRTHNTFKDVYPSDLVPTFESYPYCVVINTDNHVKKGTHWVCAYVPNPYTVEYFDSLSMIPNANIARFLNNFKKTVKNSEELQSPFSDVCGQYCIFFLIKRSSGESMASIVAYLKKRRHRDEYVRRIIALLPTI